MPERAELPSGPPGPLPHGVEELPAEKGRAPIFMTGGAISFAGANISSGGPPNAPASSTDSPVPSACVTNESALKPTASEAVGAVCKAAMARAEETYWQHAGQRPSPRRHCDIHTPRRGAPQSPGAPMQSARSRGRVVLHNRFLQHKEEAEVHSAA